jgi:hypothetical protein
MGRGLAVILAADVVGYGRLVGVFVRGDARPHGRYSSSLHRAQLRRDEPVRRIGHRSYGRRILPRR